MGKAVAKKAPVTMRALIQRINRKLSAEEEMLKVTRGDRWRGDLGDYYVVDMNRNHLVSTHVDVAALGRKLGVLAAWENVEE
jgi:hypothetical protein